MGSPPYADREWGSRAERGHSRTVAEPDFGAQLLLKEAEERSHFSDPVPLVDLRHWGVFWHTWEEWDPWEHESTGQVRLCPPKDSARGGGVIFERRKAGAATLTGGRNGRQGRHSEKKSRKEPSSISSSLGEESSCFDTQAPVSVPCAPVVSSHGTALSFQGIKKV